MRTPSGAVQKCTSWRGALGARGVDRTGAAGGSFSSATNRRPFRAIVRISACCSPLSPTALRAALMRLVSVDSETIRPPQTEAMRSSLLTTRSDQIDQQIEHPGARPEPAQSRAAARGGRRRQAAINRYLAEHNTEPKPFR